MRVLISNDDGVDAPGLAALAAAFEPVADVWVVAPASEQSAKSHSLTMHRPLRVHERGPQRFAVTGTPADAVYLALHHLLPEPPDVVVSGVNRGANLGSDVHYSGTVAAAREAALQGRRALAVSAHFDGTRPPRFDVAAALAVGLVPQMIERQLPDGVFLNLNVPLTPEPEGLRVTRLGVRRYAHAVDVRHDPRGAPYYWIGGPHLAFEGPDDGDGAAIEAGYAALTPLSADPTAPAGLEVLRDWSL
jgi:5'-nucleotidase